jgi:hypothetical protein
LNFAEFLYQKNSDESIVSENIAEKINLRFSDLNWDSSVIPQRRISRIAPDFKQA